jgi:hypothetical protein
LTKLASRNVSVSLGEVTLAPFVASDHLKKLELDYPSKGIMGPAIDAYALLLRVSCTLSIDEQSKDKRSVDGLKHENLMNPKPQHIEVIIAPNPSKQTGTVVALRTGRSKNFQGEELYACDKLRRFLAVSAMAFFLRYRRKCHR